MTALETFDPTLKVCPTGSHHISLKGCNVPLIRIADHTGHTVKRCWQLRKYVCSSRKGSNRIYNQVDRLISDVKRKVIK